MYISRDDKDVAIPFVVELFTQEGISADISNIKSWNQDFMFMDDVIRETIFAKATGRDFIIYTNTVSFKNIVANDRDIKIYDISDILKLIKKHRKFILLNHIK